MLLPTKPKPAPAAESTGTRMTPAFNGYFTPRKKSNTELTKERAGIHEAQNQTVRDVATAASYGMSGPVGIATNLGLNGLDARDAYRSGKLGSDATAQAGFGAIETLGRVAGSKYWGLAGGVFNDITEYGARNGDKPALKQWGQPRIAQRAKGGLLPRPSQAARQDATAPRNMYRSAPSGPRLTSNERGSLTGGAVRLMRKALPINAAMLAQDLMGNKVPLTEQDLSATELNVMRAAARRAALPGRRGNPNEITAYNYRDQKDVGPSEMMGTYLGDPTDFKSLVHAIKDPAHRMATTIGGGTLQPGPNGGTLLTDSFDFQTQNRNRSEQIMSSGAALKQIAKAMVRPTITRNVLKDSDGDIVTESNSRDKIYQSLLALEQNMGSTKDGKGIPSNINLGNLKRPRPGEFAKGGLLPGKLTMLGPDGKAQMELGGGNRIFSRKDTRELVSRSLKAKTPAELRELGGRIRQMLDKQDGNKPEYVSE